MVSRAAVLPLAALGAALLLARRASLRWGSRPDERTAALPGDALVPAPSLTATRAITIRAPADDVWPWIAQLGQGRAGFYSYAALENLIGCEIRNADAIVPEWQDVAVGDQIHLHPEVALAVAHVTPGHALVLHSLVAPSGSPSPPYEFSWAFVLRPTGEGTRLVVRERYACTRVWAAPLVEALGWVSCVMSLRMLRGLRDRAEAAAGPRRSGPSR